MGMRGRLLTRRWRLFEVVEGGFDGGAVEADDALAVDFGDGNRGDALDIGGVDFFVFDTHIVEPAHKSVAIRAS